MGCVCLVRAQAPLPSPPPLAKESIVVTGSYEPVPLEETDRAVHVLTITPGSALVTNTITDLLKLDSALDLRERAPDGVQADLSIRGSTFGQTLVLLNGMRLNDAQSGHHNLDIPVPLEAISQMELLRGAGSTQYGSDAVGGVINVVTRKPESTEVRLRSGLGNFGVNQERASVGFAGRKSSELLSASRDFSTGFRNDRDYRNLSLSSDTTLTDRLGPASILLAITDRPFGADQFYGNFPSWERTKGWFAGAHQNLGPNTEAAFAFRRHTDLFVLFRDRPQAFTNRHADETWEGSLRRTDNLPLGAKLHYGTEIYADSIESSNLGNHSRMREAAYVSYDARVLKRFALSAGVRDDVYSGAKNQLSPNLSGAAWLTSWLKLRAGASRAFRIPTYTDLYYHDPASLGSPGLKPESAWSYEGGMDWHGGRRWRGDVTVFQRRDTDVIDFVRFSPGDVFRATNFHHLVFNGVESSVEFAPAREQQISLSYTGLHGSRSVQPGLVSRYVFNYPVHSGIAAWQGSLGHGLIGRTRVGVLQRTGRRPYALWDAFLACQRGHVHPFLQLTNLTNTVYEEIAGVVQPRRGVIGGVEIAWSPAFK